MTDTSRDITQLIQLAIAPVFLLTAVGSTLSVLTARLARIVDRGRALEGGAPTGYSGGVHGELANIERRAKWTLRGLSLSTLAGIQVSLLIAVAFLGHALEVNTTLWVAALFVGAMAAYTGALVCLLREVYLATLSFRLIAPPPPPAKG